MEPPWVEGTKVCSRHLGHMTKMAPKTLQKSSPKPVDQFPGNLVCSIGDSAYNNLFMICSFVTRFALLIGSDIR